MPCGLDKIPKIDVILMPAAAVKMVLALEFWIRTEWNLESLALAQNNALTNNKAGEGRSTVQFKKLRVEVC